ncbi:YwdI family protein [Sporosarcina sp. HYO08]|uniref:YwdI family protein n=1 Tax=Sporosarcina sp. HYO08 TaxID=1759557 RepID=UPI00079BD01F|nr:YwdI family protein [Sporosarcina sp. HYO08]KXH83924.1 hypothetical protein AU377_04005 [Sporosarcina sp. HYO08]
MISYDRIFAEMEKQLNSARQAGSESTIRESLVAIRSLCEVALGEERNSVVQSSPKVMTAPTVVPPVSSLESKPLLESDANGESLFDF